MLTWVEINLNAIYNNLQEINKLVKPKGAKILAVIKDNAYGHGAVEVAHIAEKIPVYMLGVSTIEEAVELRQNGIRLPILIFCCISPEQVDEIIKYDIIQTVCDLKICELLSKSAQRFNKQAKIHIKVDTGMGRLGIFCYEVSQFVEKIMRFPNLIIDGIYTHFSSADTDETYTKLQADCFNSAIDILNESNIKVPLKHSANSAGILNFPEYYYDMVRPGLAIYGLYPCSEPKCKVELKPALSFKTKITYLKKLPAGYSISYERTYITNKTTVVATLPIGYGRGYNRALSNKGEVLIKGKRAPIIGTVCMDQCLCDVTSIPGVSIGDEVVLIGKQGNQEITADELAEKVGTISYEILCGINSNVPRMYFEGKLYEDGNAKKATGS